MRGCWKGTISHLQAARGNSGRRRFLECVVRVVEPSGSPTVVPCFSFLESVPGVCDVKKFIVAPESKIPKTVFCTVVFEVSSLQFNVTLFNVCSGHRHRQRPTRAPCLSNPPMMLDRVACSCAQSGGGRGDRYGWCAILQHRSRRSNSNFHCTSAEVRRAVGFRGPCVGLPDRVARV